MMMKSADVSNPTKSTDIYNEWISRITTEFFAQGDMERALGLEVSPFCNRDSPTAHDPTSSQKGFIEFIVSPLFEALEMYAPLPAISAGLQESRRRFCKEEEVFKSNLTRFENSVDTSRRARRSSFAAGFSRFTTKHAIE
jgi:3'5'-cyclic nucleotide phosphodiesterase